MPKTATRSVLAARTPGQARDATIAAPGASNPGADARRHGKLRQGHSSLGARADALEADADAVYAWAVAAAAKRSRGTGGQAASDIVVDGGAQRRLLGAIFGPADVGEALIEQPLGAADERLGAALEVLRDRVVQPSPSATSITTAGLFAALLAANLQARASNLRLESKVEALAARVTRASASRRGAQPPASARSVTLLSAAAIGRELGLTEATVYQRERKRQLFGYLPGQRQRGRVYPSFQLWEHVRGEPLERALRALGDEPSGHDATFFAALNSDLLDSTPVEVLVGERLTEREDDEQAWRLLALEPARRLDAVLAAARKFTIAAQ